MQFDLKKSIEILSRTPEVLKTQLSGLSEEWVHENEGEGTWSPYDIVGHFIHGEKTDWIPRMKIILSDKEDKTFTPFDRFAQEAESEGKTIDDLLDEFAELRNENLKTLKSTVLTAVEYSKTGIHPDFGEINLEELLATWTAHDLVHLAQLNRVMARQYKDEIGPFKNYISLLKD